MPNFLHDAIVFHKQLNPRLFEDNDMKPEIRQALMNMAAEFKDFLGLDDLDVVDITVSGSNAAYTYTPHSDIDLHLVVKIPKKDNQLYSELFDAKKNLYNLTHNQTIKGYNVEFYVQDVKTSVESIGIFSVLNGKWVSYPKRIRAAIDDLSILSKVDALTVRVNACLQSNDFEMCKKTWETIKTMRKTGLSEVGEFSPENLAYKILRTRGIIEALMGHIIEIKDKQLSVESVQESRLNELFDKGTEVKVVRSEDDEFETHATVGNRDLVFGASAVGDIDNKVVWEVAFSEEQPKKHQYDVPSSHFGITGSGGEVEVFNVVLKSINMFIKQYSPDIIKFTADKHGDSDSRAKLYQRMVARYMPAGYELRTSATDRRTNFWIEKK